jgi:hypothetical protein
MLRKERNNKKTHSFKQTNNLKQLRIKLRTIH